MNYRDVFVVMVLSIKEKEKKRKRERGTRRAASLAAMLRMSAQETAPGHLISSTVLILSMISNTLLPNPEFCGAFFSAFGPSSSIDASHPWEKSTYNSFQYQLLLFLFPFLFFIDRTFT